VKVTVVGLGNILLGDEGFGVHFVRHLAKTSFPFEIELIDGGCTGINLLHFFREREAVFLVDVFLADDPPGTIKLFSWEEIEALPSNVLVSGHQYGVKEALALARLMDLKPRRFKTLAVVPASLKPGLYLSPPLKKALRRAEKILLEELSRWEYKV